MTVASCVSPIRRITRTGCSGLTIATERGASCKVEEPAGPPEEGPSAWHCWDARSSPPVHPRCGARGDRGHPRRQGDQGRYQGGEGGWEDKLDLIRIRAF